MGNCCTERKKVEEKIDIEKEEEGINKIEAFQPQTNNSSISLPTPISPHGSSLGIITTLTSKKKINDSNQDDENELLPQTNEQKNLQSNTSSTKNTSKEKEKSSIQLLLNKFTTGYCFILRKVQDRTLNLKEYLNQIMHQLKLKYNL